MVRTMATKVQERSRALKLRRQGKSYREILAQVPVSKGTLSKWLSNLPLTKKEERFLHERTKLLQDNGRLRTARKNSERFERARDIYRVKAKANFEKFRDDPFFVLGLSLYWNSGSQSGQFSYTSSNPQQLRCMIAWANEYLPIEPADYTFRLYTPKAHANERNLRFWSRACAIPRSQFQKTVHTTTRSGRVHHETHGSLRFSIGGIEQLVTVMTWQDCLSEYYGEAH